MPITCEPRTTYEHRAMRAGFDATTTVTCDSCGIAIIVPADLGDERPVTDGAGVEWAELEHLCESDQIVSVVVTS